MSKLEISNTEYFVIIGYFVLIILVGYVFKKFSNNTDDYFKGGSKGTWWLVGTSSFMSVFSAWTFTGAAGIAYESGFSVTIIYLGNALGFFFNFLFSGPWLRQMRVTTIPEAIAMRFGNKTRDFYAFYEVPIRIVGSAMALYGMSIFCSAVFGYNINYVIIAFGIVVIFYSATGGRWGVMATDFLQGLILVPLTIIIAWLCLDKIGGIDNLFHEISSQGLKEEFSLINSAKLFGGAYTWGWAFAMLTKQTTVYNSMNAAPRYFSVKDGREARKAALLCSVLMLLGSIVWFLPPITARLLFSEQVLAYDMSKPAEASYAVASISLLPVGLVGMIIVAILASTMSTMDSGLNNAVAILIKDIYPKLKHSFNWESKEDKKLLSYGRILTCCLGFLIIILALYFAQKEDIGIFELMLTVGTLLALPIAIPMIWGLYIRQTPWWAALLSVGCALIVSCISFFEIPLTYFGFSQVYSDGFKWNFQQQFFGVFGSGTFGFLFSILFAPARNSDHRVMVDKFFKTLKTPVDFEKEIGEGNDLRQLITIGYFGAVIAGFVLLLLFIPNPIEGRFAILALALMIGGVSTLLIKAGMKSDISEKVKEEKSEFFKAKVLEKEYKKP